jgi:transposase-like protein
MKSITRLGSLPTPVFGRVVTEIAQRHGGNANLLSVSRRLYREGLLKADEPAVSL